MKMKKQLDQKIKQYIDNITKDCYEGYVLLLDKVITKLGFKSYLADFEEDISGLIRKIGDTDSYEIHVNRKHPPNRRRFTCAHELGHYISMKCKSHSEKELEATGELADYAMSYRKEGVWSEAETEANLIAATMLMPADKVDELIKQKLTIEEMAEKFYVSPSAMTIRLENLYPNLIVI